MAQMNLSSQFSFKDVITSLELADITGDGRDDILVSLMDGNLAVLEHDGNSGLSEVCRIGGLPPTVALDHGNVLGDTGYDFVVGGIDNTLRIVSYMDGKLDVKASTPLGIPPTAVCVVNVVDDDTAEIIVATNDKALRCYGWFDVALDKLAHKVVEKPIFSIQALMSQGLPYSRFVFGDDSGYVYVYQYADDRLHEVAKAKAKGGIQHVTTGYISNRRMNDIATVSDGRTLSLFTYNHPELVRIDSIQAPSPITSLRIDQFMDTDDSMGQVLASHSNSNISIIGYEGNRLIEITSLKANKKSVESLIAQGDFTGDSRTDIVQAVGKKLNLITLS
ncbi:MAG: hypothetical protein RTU92_08755 [Candidatus Thorarchaeota archaeon]